VKHVEALRLVAITDNLRDGIDGLLMRAVAARRGGATMIQLRLPDESAHMVVQVARALISALDSPLVLHGRLDTALAAGAAGIHLAVRDIGVGDVRRIVGDDFIIGRSVASDADLQLAAGADYVAIGPVFATTGGPRREASIGITEFERLVHSATSAAIAIGGISAATAPDALRAGACGVALISGIFGSPDPEQAAREVRAAIGT
jgi:thiamine-phosphate pyrophosphorylase